MPVEQLRYDQVQQRSIHNSYVKGKVEGLIDQLVYYRIRNLEWDIHSTRPDTSQAPGGNDWWMYHIGAASDWGRFAQLSDGLRLLRAYHNAVPEHEVITLDLELKGWSEGNHEGAFYHTPEQTPEGLDDRLRGDLGDALFTPLDLLGTCPEQTTLLEAVTTCGWPMLDKLRGKIIVMLHAWTSVGEVGVFRNVDTNPGHIALLRDYAQHGAAANQRVAFIAPLKINESPTWEDDLLTRYPYVIFHTEVGDFQRAREIRARFPGSIFRSGERAEELNFRKAQEDFQLINTDHVSWHHVPWARTHNEFGYPFCPLGVVGEDCWTRPHDLSEKRELGHLLAIDVRSGDIEKAHDDFAFAHVLTPLASSGPQTWTAFISNASNSETVEHWAKGGLMARMDLSPESPYYAVCRAGDDEELFIQYRGFGCSGPCGTARASASLGHGIEGEDATFVKLELWPTDTGGTIAQGYGSADGANWQAIGPPATFPVDLQYQGIAASSHDPEKSAPDGAPTRFLFGNVVRNGERLGFDSSPQTVRFTGRDRIGTVPLAQFQDLSYFGPRPPDRRFTPVYQEGDPGSGIGGFNLASETDRAFAFDYDGSGMLDHLALYRPGTGTMWILKNSGGAFTPVYQEGDPGSGIGGFNLASETDRAFAFDYDGSGKLDHLALYRPGTGTMWILKNSGGAFTPVYQEGDPGSGIGGFNLASETDRAFAFDYDGSGMLDHLALYRPGTGTMWILKNSGGAFTPVYQEGDPGSGIGGFNLASETDRAFAFDYDGSGKLDHLALYRPGTGTMWILKNSGGAFTPVYQEGDPGSGIGGFNLASETDRAFAFDYDGSGKLDHLALYRPGTGTMWILKNSGGAFTPVYQEGDPGSGIGGFNLASETDRAFAFDYDGSGMLDHLALYRPGTGTMWILSQPKMVGRSVTPLIDFP